MKLLFLHTAGPFKGLSKLAIVLSILNLLLLASGAYAQVENATAVGANGTQSRQEQDRSAELAQVASRQFESGDWAGAFSTAASLEYDSDRAELLNELSQKRVGSQQETRRRIIGAAGGVTAADFTNLIDLITATIAPDSWQDTGQGLGTIQSYPAGVYVDPEGTLQKSRLTQKGLTSSSCCD